MTRINLLPVKAVQRRQKLIGQLVVLGVSLALVGGGCAVAYASVVSKIEAERQAMARTQDELNQLRRTLGEVAQYKKLQTELEGKIGVLTKLKNARSGPVKLLDELSNALPEGLWLTSFKETGGSVAISGLGLNEKVVAVFLRNLESSPYYRNVELRVIEQMTQGDQRLHKFDLTCMVATSAPPPVAPTASQRTPARR